MTNDNFSLGKKGLAFFLAGYLFCIPTYKLPGYHAVFSHRSSSAQYENYKEPRTTKKFPELDPAIMPEELSMEEVFTKKKGQKKPKFQR